MKLYAIRFEASCCSVRTLQRLRKAVEKAAEPFWGTKRGLSVLGSSEGEIVRDGGFKDRQWGNRRGGRRN